MVVGWWEGERARGERIEKKRKNKTKRNDTIPTLVLTVQSRGCAERGSKAATREGKREREKTEKSPWRRREKNRKSRKTKTKLKITSKWWLHGKSPPRTAARSTTTSSSTSSAASALTPPSSTAFTASPLALPTSSSAAASSSLTGPFFNSVNSDFGRSFNLSIEFPWQSELCVCFFFWAAQGLQRHSRRVRERGEVLSLHRKRSFLWVFASGPSHSLYVHQVSLFVCLYPDKVFPFFSFSSNWWVALLLQIFARRVQGSPGYSIDRWREMHVEKSLRRRMPETCSGKC